MTDVVCVHCVEWASASDSPTQRHIFAVALALALAAAVVVVVVAVVVEWIDEFFQDVICVFECVIWTWI